MEFKGTPETWLEWLVGTDEQRSHDARLALGGLTPDDGIAPDRFIDALSSGDDDVVFWSTVALARLESTAIAAVLPLLELASQHGAFRVRQSAIAALSRIDAARPSVKAGLLAALRDENAFVRREALQALIHVPSLGRTELRLIAEMSSDPDPNVARWSEIALRNIKADRRRDA